MTFLDALSNHKELDDQQISSYVHWYQNMMDVIFVDD